MRGHIASLVCLLALAWAAWIPAEPARARTSQTRPELPLGPLGATPPRTVSSPTPRTIPRSERIQFVLLGMDTTPHWQQRGFENLFERINLRRAAGTPPNSFTLFIGTGGFQFDETSRELTAEEERFRGVLPRHNPVFDYAESLEQIHGKAENVRRLHQLGVEIGSHTVRHEHGEDWTRERWEFEFADHARILTLMGLPQPVGFRAPFLGRNDAMYETLAARGFGYDASEPSNSLHWPHRRPGSNVWMFGIPSVPFEGRDRPLLFFDLNMEARLRRAAIAAGMEGEAAIVRWMDARYYALGYAAFRQRYRTSRAPFLISGHGAFFREPTILLMRHICRMPDVRCATFREAAEYMQTHPEMEDAF